MSLENAIDRYTEQEGLHCFEGETGVRHLTQLIKAIGYQSLNSFLADNAGCIEAMINWIKETDFDEWEASVREELDHCKFDDID